MSNNPRPAIFVNPKVAIELHQCIKLFDGFKTEEAKQCFVNFVLGDGLTDRDLVLFLLGKIAGIEAGCECPAPFACKCVEETHE
jgi:hypothetical protein